jgi:tetratricopeptide (TPR) repeat protein
MAKKNLDRAIADFGKAITMTPQGRADDHLLLGLALLEKKDYDRAISNLDEAIQLNPNPDAAYFAARGTAFLARKDYKRAVDDLSAAIKADPTNSVALNNRGFAYNALGNYALAIHDLNEAIRQNPKLAAAYKNRGMNFEKRGKFVSANRDFRRAIALDPHLKEAAAGAARMKQRLTFKTSSAQGRPTTGPQLQGEDRSGDQDKAALTRVLKGAVAARHGGALPEVMSTEDAEVAAKAAIEWKKKQAREKTRQVLNAMKHKPPPSDGYAEIYLAKEAIKKIMRDPTSAVFDGIFFVNDRTSATGYYVPVVCGTVNGKNGFGGMTGPKHFVAIMSEAAQGVWLEGTTAQNVVTREWNRFCARRG